MKNKKNKFINIFIIEIIIPGLLLLISYFCFKSKLNGIIYNYVLPIESIIVPVILAWEKDKQLRIREEKVKNYNFFIDALTDKLSNYNKGTLTNEINENFCREANRLSLYASNEVIECVNKIGEGESISANELIQKIRKDIIDYDFNYTSNINLTFHIDSTIINSKTNK